MYRRKRYTLEPKELFQMSSWSQNSSFQTHKSRLLRVLRVEYSSTTRVMETQRPTLILVGFGAHDCTSKDLSPFICTFNSSKPRVKRQSAQVEGIMFNNNTVIIRSPTFQPSILNSTCSLACYTSAFPNKRIPAFFHPLMLIIHLYTILSFPISIRPLRS